MRAVVMALSLALLIALPSASLAQASRPIGANPDAPSDFRAGLGECRDDLLREAWLEIRPLEANAVESEVIALCTERSEAIARFLAAQERLDRALAERRAPSATAANPEPGPDDARMERLRGEIESLRARIARLEGEPKRPETDAALADLRDDLATAKADLALMERGEVTASGSSDIPPPVAAVTDADESDLPETDIAPPSAADTLDAPGPDTQDAGSDDGIASVPPPTGEHAAASIPPPGTDLSGTTSPMAAQAAPGLPEGTAEWRVVHAVRRDGGTWQVRLQADRMTRIEIAGATAEAPATFIFRPVSDPAVTLAVGDVLPGGLALLAVTPVGVEIGDPEDPDAVPLLVRFATAGDSEPGALEWDVQLLEGADQ